MTHFHVSRIRRFDVKIITFIALHTLRGQLYAESLDIIVSYNALISPTYENYYSLCLNRLLPRCCLIFRFIPTVHFHKHDGKLKVLKWKRNMKIHFWHTFFKSLA